MLSPSNLHSGKSRGVGCACGAGEALLVSSLAHSDVSEAGYAWRALAVLHLAQRLQVESKCV